MARFAEAVAFARVAREHGLDIAAAQGHVHLFGLRDVYVVVQLAVDKERRRLDGAHVAQRRPTPQQIIIVPREAAKLGVDQILIKRRGVEADEVRDGRAGDGGAKTRRLRDDPVGHKAAV